MFIFVIVNKFNRGDFVFYANYISLCNKLNKSPSAVAEEMGFKRSVVTAWKKGRQPREATLMKIADYFGVTVDDLVSNSTTMSYGSTPLLDAKKAIIKNDDGLNEKYAKYDALIDLFDSLPPERQDAVIRQLQEIVRLQKVQDDLLKF